MEKSPIYPALFRLHQLQNITTNYFTSLSSSETGCARVTNQIRPGKGRFENIRDIVIHREELSRDDGITMANE